MLSPFHGRASLTALRDAAQHEEIAVLFASCGDHGLRLCPNAPPSRTMRSSCEITTATGRLRNALVLRTARLIAHDVKVEDLQFEVTVPVLRHRIPRRYVGASSECFTPLSKIFSGAVCRCVVIVAHEQSAMPEAARPTRAASTRLRVHRTRRVGCPRGAWGGENNPTVPCPTTTSRLLYRSRDCRAQSHDIP